MKPKSERPRTKPAHVAAMKPRKAKPVFEIPRETARPAETEWVYRSGEVAALQAVEPVGGVMAAAQVKNFASDESPHILIVASVSMFVAGLAAMGLMSLATLSMAGAPVMMVRSLFWRS